MTLLRDVIFTALCASVLFQIALYVNAPEVEAKAVANFVKAYNAEMLK